MAAARETYVVTGCAGLIGSNTCAALVARGVRVIGVDNFSVGCRANVPRGVELLELDLVRDADYAALDAALAPLRGTRWYLLHFAAYAAEALSPFVRRFNADVNVKAASGLVTLAIKHAAARFVFTSSMAVYGHAAPPFDEDATPVAPADPYGAAKAFVETDLRIAAAQHGLSYCVLRPHNVQGRGVALGDRYRNVLAIWARQLLRGEALTIFGDGSQTRAFTHVADLVPAVLHAATAPAAHCATINVGGRTPVTIAAAAAEMLRAAGRGTVVHLPPRHEAHDAYCSGTRAAEVLHFVEAHTLADIVADVWRWAQDMDGGAALAGPPYELTVGMPPSWRDA